MSNLIYTYRGVYVDPMCAWQGREGGDVGQSCACSQKVAGNAYIQSQSSFVGKQVRDSIHSWFVYLSNMYINTMLIPTILYLNDILWAIRQPKAQDH